MNLLNDLEVFLVLEIIYVCNYIGKYIILEILDYFSNYLKIFIVGYVLFIVDGY